MLVNKTIINDAVEVIVEYLIEHGKSTAERLQDEIAAKMEIEPGIMNEVYEAAMDQLEEEVLVDFIGISLKY